MWAVSRSGPGMDSIVVWNGAPALCPGAQISAAILRRVFARNMPVARTVYSGLKSAGSGSIIQQNRHLEWSYSSTGITRGIPARKMVVLIIPVLLRKRKTACFILLRGTLGMSAGREYIRWDITRFLDMEF